MGKGEVSEEEAGRSEAGVGGGGQEGVKVENRYGRGRVKG